MPSSSASSSAAEASMWCKWWCRLRIGLMMMMMMLLMSCQHYAQAFSQPSAAAAAARRGGAGSISSAAFSSSPRAAPRLMVGDNNNNKRSSIIRSYSSSSSSSTTALWHGPMMGHSHSHHHASSSKKKKTKSKQRPFFLLRRNAAIRVSVATAALFLIASFTTKANSLKLNLALSGVFGLFLSAFEQSRGYMAAWRVRANEMWQTVEAHMGTSAANSAANSELQENSQNSNEDYDTTANNNNNNNTGRTAEEHQAAVAAERITLVGTAVNIGLTVFKLVAGIVGKSSAMVADAGHSLSDLASDMVTLWTVRIARLPADEDHPYGHGRFEALGALAVAGMLVMAAVGFGTFAYESFVQLVLRSSATTAAATAAGPTGRIALIAAAVSILSKEALYRATAVVAQRTQSQVLLANAWHHRSDAFSSIVALLSIWGAQHASIPALDPLGGLLVAGMVGITGLRVGWSAMLQLTDTQDLELKKQIEKAVHRAVLDYQLQDDVLNLHAVRARFLGSRAWVDLEVETNPMRTTSAATQVVQVLRNAILRRIPSVQDVAVVLKSTSTSTNEQQQQQQQQTESSTVVDGTGGDEALSTLAASSAGRVATAVSGSDVASSSKVVNGATTNSGSATAMTTSADDVDDVNHDYFAHDDDDDDEHDHNHDHASDNDNDDAALLTRTSDPDNHVVAVSPLQVEEDVRRALQQSSAFIKNSSNHPQIGFSAVEHVLVHFSSNSNQCHVDIIVSVLEQDDDTANNNTAPCLSLSQAKELAQVARQDVIRLADGVVDAKVSLELVRSGTTSSSDDDDDDDDDSSLAESSSTATTLDRNTTTTTTTV